jgi:hypothetical protein
MKKKVLTYLTILAITALPVQLISANAESLNMQMSMLQSMSTQTQATNECMHEKTEQKSIDKSCCDDQSHECQSCNNCPQAASAMFLPFYPVVKTASLNTEKYFTSYSFLNGIPQNNLLRPPRTLI